MMLLIKKCFMSLIEEKKESAFMNKLEKDGAKITLKHIYGKKGGSAHIRPTRHPQSNEYLGFKELSVREQETAEPWFINKNSSMIIHHDKEIDLSIPSVKALWQMVKYSNLISFTKGEAKPNDALYYVYAEEEVTKVRLSSKKRVIAAKNLIIEDDPKNLSLRVRLLGGGYDMSSDSTDVIMDHLLEVADSNPEKIEDIYSNSLNSLKILFYKGLDSGKIVKDRDLYMYGSINLGVTEDACVTFMNKSTSLELVEKMREHIEGELIIPTKVTKAPVVKDNTDEGNNTDEVKEPNKMNGEELSAYIESNDIDLGGETNFLKKKKIAQDFFEKQ